MQRKCNEFEAWLAKYEPVEQAILAARDRRFEHRRKRAAQRAKHVGDLCEMTEGRAKSWAREDRAEMHTNGVLSRTRTTDELGDPLVLTDVVIAVLTPYLRWVRTAATKYVKRLTDAARRPLYYERENARRQALAAARRKVVKRQTLNACPTREAILDAWVHRRDSHEASIRFGGLIMDLECYLDNSLLFAENGAICGRRGGVKRWLQTEIPALYLCYGTVMRYKAHAAKLRQILELADPIPVSRILQGPASQQTPHGGCKVKLQGIPGNDFSDSTPQEVFGSGSKDATTSDVTEKDYVAEIKRGVRDPGHNLVYEDEDRSAHKSHITLTGEQIRDELVRE